jgi:hypothetical protein
MLNWSDVDWADRFLFCARKQKLNWWPHRYTYVLSVWKLRWHPPRYFYLSLFLYEHRYQAEIRFSRFFSMIITPWKSWWRYWWFCQVVSYTLIREQEGKRIIVSLVAVFTVDELGSTYIPV